MSGVSTRWFAFARVEDRAGASTGLAGVFSERGVSFGSISTLDVHDGLGTLSVEFTASERLAHVLVRTLERLTVVLDVTLVAADDPSARAVAVFDGEDLGDVPAGLGSWSDGSVSVLTGPLTLVREAVRRRRATGQAPVAVTVLPPQPDAGD